MTLDLSTGYAKTSDFGHSQQNAHDLMSKPLAKAVLYIFKPFRNQFGDVSLRPFAYQFDENFLGSTQELSDMATRGTANAGAMVKDLMQRHNLNDNMLPAFQPTMTMKTSALSDRHRFILVLTESARGLIGGNTIGHSNPNSAVRRIYSGYFTDEPLNYSMNTRSLNKNAFMVITHKTSVGTHTVHGSLGAETRLNTTVSEEVLHPTVSQSLLGFDGTAKTELHLMTPENCINSIETNSEGLSLSIPGAHSNISLDTGANVVTDILERPSLNVAQVVKGMVLFGEDTATRGRLHNSRNHDFFEDEFLSDGFNRSSLGSYMALPRSKPVSVFDLNVDQSISPVDLDKMVSGDIDIIDFNLNRPMYYETADQQEISIINQYSFLIASVVVPILNSAGLNAMQFDYSIAPMNAMLDENFNTHAAEPYYPVPNNDLLQMAAAVKYELMRGIFATIYGSMGAFHVSVSANTTGMTIVRLSLVGAGMRSYADFEMPSCMGGLISPLLGDATTNSHNSEQIEGLYNQATGTQKALNNLNADDRAFADLAEGMQFGNDLTMGRGDYPRIGEPLRF